MRCQRRRSAHVWSLMRLWPWPLACFPERPRPGKPPPDDVIARRFRFSSGRARVVSGDRGRGTPGRAHVVVAGGHRRYGAHVCRTCAALASYGRRGPADFFFSNDGWRSPRCRAESSRGSPRLSRARPRRLTAAAALSPCHCRVVSRNSPFVSRRALVRCLCCEHGST